MPESKKRQPSVYRQLKGPAGEALRAGISKGKQMTHFSKMFMVHCAPALFFMFLYSVIVILSWNLRAGLVVFLLVFFAFCGFHAWRDYQKQYNLVQHKNVAYLMKYAGLSSEEQLPDLCHRIYEELQTDITVINGIIIGKNWVVGDGWVIPSSCLLRVCCHYKGEKGLRFYTYSWVVFLQAKGGVELECMAVSQKDPYRSLDRTPSPGQVYDALCKQFPHLQPSISGPRSYFQ